MGKNVKNLLNMVEQRFHLYESGFDGVQGMTDALRAVFAVKSTPQKNVEIDFLEIYLTSFTRNLTECGVSDIETASFSLPAFKRSDFSKNG